MAKPITPTPVIKGKAAKRIMKEVREGTPRTPEREATLQRAKQVFRQSTQKSGWANR
jgi:hypothetical protein